jgi:hypothetical protein
MTTTVTATPYTTIRACWCHECASQLPRMLTTYHPNRDAARNYGLDLARTGHRVEMYRGHVTEGTRDRLVGTITPTSEWYDVPRSHRGAPQIAQLVRTDLRAARRSGALDIPDNVRMSVHGDSTPIQAGIRVELTDPTGWAEDHDRNTPSDQARAAAAVIRETFEAHTNGYTWCEVLIGTMLLASVKPHRA